MKDFLRPNSAIGPSDIRMKRKTPAPDFFWRLKNYISRFLNNARFIADYGYDGLRYIQASTAARRPNDPEKLAALITMDYHRIEKGLALQEPKPGFGQDVVRRLADNVALYERQFGVGALTFISRKVLRAYVAFNDHCQIQFPDLEEFLRQGVQPDVATEGGTRELAFSGVFPFSNEEARRFILSRHSVRQFTGRIVSKDLIEQSVSLAQKAPSVCNRQSARIFVSNDPARMAEILEFQNGNRGFGEKLGAVFIVTADMRAFTTLGERNQAWVDGGIFAMSLAHALHAQHLGACMLNWSMKGKHDKKMRRAFGIEDNYAVITMLGAGYVPEKIRVAASPRRSTKDIIKWL